MDTLSKVAQKLQLRESLQSILLMKRKEKLPKESFSTKGNIRSMEVKSNRQVMLNLSILPFPQTNLKS